MDQVNSFEKLIAISNQYLAAVEELWQCIRNNRYAALLGPRYSGKTDILEVLFEKVSSEAHYTTIKADLYKVNITAPSLLFGRLIRVIGDVSPQKNDLQLFSDYLVEPTSADFRAFIQEKLATEKRSMVLILDHLEALPRDIAHALLTCLRSQFMEQQSQPFQLIVIVSGALSLAIQTTGETSPFYNIVTRVILRDLSREESNTLVSLEMARNKATISSKARQLFVDSTQGDPFLIQELINRCLDHHHKRLPRHINVVTVTRVIENFFNNESATYNPLWEAIHLVEDDPNLLQSILILLDRGTVRRSDLPLSLMPDIDPLMLTNLVQRVGENHYAVRNEIYKEFLLRKFNPGYVGNLFLAHGRWDLSISYLEKSIGAGDYRFHSSLLETTISAMYGANTVNRAAYYLQKGLEIGFGVRQAKIWMKVHGRDLLMELEEFGFDDQVMAQEISIQQDSLEGRAFRERITFRDQIENRDSKIVFPLIASGRQTVGVVSLYNYSSLNRDTEIQLYGYLNRAARALSEVDTRQKQSEQLQHQDLQLRKKTELLYLLYRISTFIQTMTDLDKVLHLILTVTTAHFGMKFNRAWLFTSNERRTYLDGRAAIGEITETDAHRAWERFANRSFDEYLENLLKLRALESTAIALATNTMHLPTGGSLRDAFSYVLEKQHTVKWSSSSKEYGDLPSDFQIQFDVEEALIAPLLFENNCIGLLIADNKFNKQMIDAIDEELLSTFANLVAMAIMQDHKRQSEQSRLEIAETFREVSRVINSSLELDAVLDSILNQMTRVLPFDTASIQTLNVEKNALQIIRSRGFKDEASINELTFPLDGNFPNVHVFNTKEVLKFDDIQKFYSHFSNPNYGVQEIHGWLGVPLIVEDHSIGVITLDSYTPDIYTIAHHAIALAFAGQAAVAIENAQLFQELENEYALRSEESQALQSVGVSLTSTIELNEVLDRVVQAALRLVHGDECSILFFDDAQDTFSSDALMSSGLGQPLQVYETQVRSPDGLAYKIIKEKSVIIISDTQSNSRISKVAIQKGRRAMVGVPLISHQGSVGVLWVNWKSPRQLSDREANLLTALASQATVAIQAAKRYAEVQEYVRLREGLLKAGQEIIALKKPEVVFMSIVDNIKDALKCDVVTLYTYDQKTKMFGFPAYVGGELKNPSGIGKLGRVSSESVVGKILDFGEAYFADNTGNDPLMNFRGSDRPMDLPSFVEREDIMSSASIPLKVGDEELGILFLNYRYLNPFTQQKRDAINLFSNIMAIAIHNAKQYNALQETQDKLFSAGTIAWMGLFGSDWSHTVAQRTYSIRTYARTIREVMRDQNPRIQEMLNQIDVIAQDIQGVPLAISTPSQAEIGKPLLIDTFLASEITALCKKAQQVHLHFNLNCEQINVQTDKSLFKMALQKLVDNAIRHMPSGGDLYIKSCLSGDVAVITLRDTGDGIPEEYKASYGQRRILKKDTESGSGMGAMLARFILQKYGGELKLLWSEKQKGTKIEISLPVYEEPTRDLS